MARIPARERYLAAALAILDDGEELTLHRLGDRLGLTHTAVYRHFPNLAELVGEITARLLTDHLPTDPDRAATPRERITHLARAVRAGFVAHPALAAVVSSSTAVAPSQLRMQELVLVELRAMGLDGTALTTAYQALEGIVIGVTAFDLDAAPEHVTSRAARMRLVEDRDFRALGRSEQRVAAHTETAFGFALEAVLDAVERLAGEPPG